MKSNHPPHYSHIFSAPVAAGFIALSVGMPNGCVNVHEADIDPIASGVGTWDDPIIVRRDNLAVVGNLEVTDALVTSKVSSPYFTDGTWTSLTGHIRLEELRSDGSAYVDQYSPILPRSEFYGPGQAPYGTRAGVMVHGNTYALHLSAADEGGDSFSNEKEVVYVKLADDVLLVPIVVVSWKRPGVDPTFVDHTHRARNMFDFHPLHIDDSAAPSPYTLPDNTMVTPLPLPSIQALLANQVDSPSSSSAFSATVAPDALEVPPDDIWAECGIQFQVVAQFIADLPEDWINECDTLGANFPDPHDVVKAELDNHPLLRDYLLNDLEPIFISYGDLKECHTDWMQDGFFASTVDYDLIEVTTGGRPRTITSHELGHALGLDHAVDPVTHHPIQGNLMRENPKNGERDLTPQQCEYARGQAQNLFSENYDYFNWVTGRTYADVPAPPPSGAAVEDHGEFNPGGESQVCCLGVDDVYTTTGSCEKEVDMEQCIEVCCESSDSIFSTTLFRCSQLQGVAHNISVCHD